MDFDYESESTDNENADSSFNPSSIYEPTNAETTPSQRVMEGTSMSEAAKKRVDKVTVKRCLIENTPESNHLDYSHCLRRSTRGDLASSSQSVVSLTTNNNPLRFSLTSSSLPGAWNGLL